MEDRVEKKSGLSGWLKWLLGILLALIILLGGTVTAIVVLLKPEQLTELVETYAPRFINGEVKVKRVELTFWHTFPRLTVDVDSLTLISHALDSLPAEFKKELPSWSDTLLTIDKFQGNLNLKKLMKGNLEIYGITIDNPSVNIVTAKEGISNYDIINTTEEDSDTTAFIRSVALDHFIIKGSGPLRYCSIPDTLFLEALIRNVDVNGEEAPSYNLVTGGTVKGTLLEPFEIKELDFSVDARASYGFTEGLSSLTIYNLDAQIDSLSTSLSVSALLSRDSVRIESFKASVRNITPEGVKGFLPIEVKKDLASLHSNLNGAVNVEMTEPYSFAIADSITASSLPIPSAVIDIDIPRCHVRWPSQRLNIDNFILKTRVTVNGNNLNDSRIELERLLVDGQAIDVDMRALVTRPIGNISVAGEIKGRVFLDRLPPMAFSQFPGRLSGTVGMNTKFRLRKNDLTPNNFHKIFARGTVSLRDMDVRMGHEHQDGAEDSLRLYTPLAMLHFDSNKAVDANGVMVDSLLEVTVNADSLYYAGDGMVVSISSLNTALGSKNIAQSSDTTRINPFGGTLTAGRFRLVSEVDSTRFSVRDMTVKGSVSRFEGLDRVPRLNLDISARRISAAEPDIRISVNQPVFSLNANINPRREGRQRHRRDETRGNDSVPTVGDAMDNHRHVREPRGGDADSLATGLRSLLRRWNVKGNFTARRARVFTPAFPLNNTLSNLDLSFTTDSIELKSMKLKAGASDFNISGTVAGIKRSMSTRRRSPIEMQFNMTSDTIDIDELSRAVFAGAAAERDTSLWTASVDETEDVNNVLSVDTTATAALIISPYMDAVLEFRSKNVLYAGMMLHDFSGELGMWDQAIHLHDLNASSPMGDLSLSALYSAPSAENLEFGMGMELQDFHLERFLQVTPAVKELLPALSDLSGIINADIAMTTRLDSDMDFIIPSMEADIKIDGDSLVLLDADTFKTMSKWLFFKNKKRNLIDHMSVQLQVDSSQIVIFPFIFNIDRYKLGVMGTNDLDMNFSYHVSVLKSPIPFKFGINISGNLDKYKIKLGGAKIKENTTVERVAINSETRINLINQLENVFRRGANSSTQKVHVHKDKTHADNIQSELEKDDSTHLSDEQKLELETIDTDNDTTE